MSDMKLHPAFWWTCPVCGHENFGKYDIPVEIAEEDREQPELEGAETGEFVMGPDEITCAKCGETFEVPEEEGPDDE